MQDAETVLDVLRERGRRGLNAPPTTASVGSLMAKRDQDPLVCPPPHTSSTHGRQLPRPWNKSLESRDAGKPARPVRAGGRRKRTCPLQAPRRRPTGALWDADFGPAFIKICAYFPYPIKVWLNGHEWAKRQASQAGIGFTELSNGFATCADPAALQAICDRLGPGTIGVFFERWMAELPLPLTEHDRAAGYWWELSMRQVEVSRTLVFDAPRHARGFFEALVADNLDIGRPDSCGTDLRRGQRRGAKAPKLDCVPKTKIVTYGTEVTVNAFYKHSRIKQYLKGRAGAAHRDRDQLARRPALPPPAGPSRRAAGPSPCRQPPSARY